MDQPVSPLSNQPLFKSGGHVALITGGSKGIGFAIAEELAKKGYNLLLVARSESELKVVCDELSSKYQIKADYLPIDLSQSDSPDKVFEFIKGKNLSVSVLVNNAGIASWGSFEELSFEEQRQILMVNVVNLLKLTHLLIPGLKKQAKSYILNVASTTAYQAIANFGVYAASKTFVVSFSRALRYELKHTPISVSCLSPGTTTSNFMNRAGLHSERIRKQASKVTMKPSEVAIFAVNGMLKGKNEMIPGFLNRFSSILTRFVPKAWSEKIAANIYK